MNQFVNAPGGLRETSNVRDDALFLEIKILCSFLRGGAMFYPIGVFWFLN